jgi:hypothetical protein
MSYEKFLYKQGFFANMTVPVGNAAKIDWEIIHRTKEVLVREGYNKDVEKSLACA